MPPFGDDNTFNNIPVIRRLVARMETIWCDWKKFIAEGFVTIKNGGGLIITESETDPHTVTIEVDCDYCGGGGGEGGVSQIIAGTNITVDPVGGTGAVTIHADDTVFYFERTYAQARLDVTLGLLIPGGKYKITDHEEIYDQPISGTLKTGPVEPLILTAISTTQFSPLAVSTAWPDDVILYDILPDSTPFSMNPAKGRIWYRKDNRGAEAWYDFRNVLIYSPWSMTEEPTFFTTTVATELSMPFDYCVGVYGVQHPATTIQGIALNNTKLLAYNVYFAGNVGDNSACELQNTPIGGNFYQNGGMQIFDCSITGGVEFSVGSVLNNSTFGGSVTKFTNSNINNSSVGGDATRLVNGAILLSNIGGTLYWCNGFAIFSSNIDGDVRGLNNFFWDNTDCNCNVDAVCGLADAGSTTGFQGCTITGNALASKLQYCHVKCLVQNKTIDEATYPELFSAASTDIFKGSDGLIYYSYYNGATLVVTQIV